VHILSRRSPHSGRLERWLGADKIEHLVENMRGWYGPPIYLHDVPGAVRITPDGDFIGDFDRGFCASALDVIADQAKQFWKRLQFERGFCERTFGVGFSTISAALASASSGGSQVLMVQKAGPTGVLAVASSLWRVGNTPAAGVTPSASPGGNAPVDTTQGGMGFNNPASGTLHLVGADLSASVINNSLLIYDRIFHVAKTMNSVATEAVTGVPTRYQSTTATDPDYIGGNFLFVEVGGTALANTAHNWTVCQYTDQSGAGTSTLPSLTGNAAAIVDRLDHPVGSWFAPLETGDTGIMKLTQMQCSALVATGLANFVIGHPLGFMTFPVANAMWPNGWLSDRNQAPRVFDDACVSLLEMPKPATTATNYNGVIHLTRAA
jgi:hypothetical protein